MNHFGKYTSEYPNYVDALEDAGYFVGFTGKGCRPGQTVGFHHDDAAGRAYQSHQHRPPVGGISKNDYLANFAQFLEDRPDETPFCFWMGISEPHRRYELGSGVSAGKAIADVTLPSYYPDSDEIRSDFLDYAIEVEWFDKRLGQAMRLLKELGELNDTLLIITSDHGMQFPRVKGNIYDDAVHIPLAIRWGDHIPYDRVVDDFVNLRDLAPTILDIADVDPDTRMTGDSLQSILESSRSGRVELGRDFTLIGKERHSAGRENGWGYPVRGIRTERYLFKINYEPDRWPACNPETGLANCDRSPTKDLLVAMKGHFYDVSFGKRPREELFDLFADPQCMHNIADEQSVAELKQRLKTQMLAALTADRDPRTIGDPAVLIKEQSNAKYLKMKADVTEKLKTKKKDKE